jgi:hypothetical protein
LAQSHGEEVDWEKVGSSHVIAIDGAVMNGAKELVGM